MVHQHAENRPHRPVERWRSESRPPRRVLRVGSLSDLQTAARYSGWQSVPFVSFWLRGYPDAIFGAEICQRCLDDPAATSYLTGVQARAVELQHSAIDRVCKFCSSLPILDAVECTSTDCAVYYTRTKAVRALAILEAGENNVLDL